MTLEENKVPKVNIIITTREILENTKRCLQSIRECTNYPINRIIAVDDCSTDGSIEWLREQEDVTLLENDTTTPDYPWSRKPPSTMTDRLRMKDRVYRYPHGMYIGLQIGMDYEKADYYVFAERDDVYTPNWLTKLMELMQVDKTIGMSVCIGQGGAQDSSLPQGGGVDMRNPVQIYWTQNQPKTAQGRKSWIKMRSEKTKTRWVPRIISNEEIMKFGAYIEKFFWRKYRYIGLIWFGHCMVSHKCITDVPLDLDFFRADGDNDWCIRATRAGYRMACRMDTYAQTLPSAHASGLKWARAHTDEGFYKRKHPDPRFLPAGKVMIIPKKTIKVTIDPKPTPKIVTPKKVKKISEPPKIELPPVKTPKRLNIPKNAKDRDEYIKRVTEQGI